MSYVRKGDGAILACLDLEPVLERHSFDDLFGS